MTLIKEYNLMENKKVIFWLNVASIPLIFFFFLFFTLFTYLFLGTTELSGSFSFGDGTFFGFIAFFIGLFLLIIIHELIHGLFFKVFNKEGKVKFGFKNGMAYATSPDSFYSKGKFIWISLAPFILISSALGVLVALDLIPVVLFISLASMHAASCVGDFYWVLLLSRRPNTILVQDTETGMSVYLDDKQTHRNSVKKV